MRGAVWGFSSFMAFVLKIFLFLIFGSTWLFIESTCKEKGDLGSLIFFP